MWPSQPRASCGDSGARRHYADRSRAGPAARADVAGDIRERRSATPTRRRSSARRSSSSPSCCASSTAGAPRKTRIQVDDASALIELRDALAEAKPEDQGSILEQMHRIEALSRQRGKGDTPPVDRKSPYFGHLRLEESGKRRDVLIGARSFVEPGGGVQIVDWRNAPGVAPLLPLRRGRRLRGAARRSPGRGRGAGAPHGRHRRRRSCAGWPRRRGRSRATCAPGPGARSPPGRRSCRSRATARPPR